MDALLMQNYPHNRIELVVIDGQSEDTTVSIIKNILKKSDYAFKILSENKGLGYARQVALEQASGEYILWIDGDIAIEENYVKALVTHLERNPKVGIAAGKIRFETGQGVVASLEESDWIAWNHGRNSKTIKGNLRIICAGSVFRKQAIRDAGGFDSGIKGAGEDMDLGYRISRKGWLTSDGINVFMKHKGRETWISLWNHTVWYGYGAHYVMHKYASRIQSSSITFFFREPVDAYRLTKRKISLLLPVLLIIERIAWLYGFTKAHFDSYDPKPE